MSDKLHPTYYTEYEGGNKLPWRWGPVSALYLENVLKQMAGNTNPHSAAIIDLPENNQIAVHTLLGRNFTWDIITGMDLPYKLEPVPRGPQLGDCLGEAKEIICGERQDQYGAPEDSFSIIADYWNTFLRERRRSVLKEAGAEMRGADLLPLLGPRDVVNMLILFKQARKLGQKHSRDNYVDSCGYESIAADRFSV